MRFRRYSVSEPRKSQVSFILQSIGSRDTQGWAWFFSGGAIEGWERKGGGGILQDGWTGVATGVERLSTSVLKVCDSLQIDSLSSF